MATLQLVGTKGAASSGIRFPLRAPNSALKIVNAANIDAVFNTATDGSEDCEVQFSVNKLGSFTTPLKLNTLSAKFAANVDVAVNVGGLTTTATKGFLFVPSSAGPSTGVPANTYTGCVAIKYDRTNNKLEVYNAGWVKSAALT